MFALCSLSRYLQLFAQKNHVGNDLPIHYTRHGHELLSNFSYRVSPLLNKASIYIHFNGQDTIWFNLASKAPFNESGDTVA